MRLPRFTTLQLLLLTTLAALLVSLFTSAWRLPPVITDQNGAWFDPAQSELLWLERRLIVFVPMHRRIIQNTTFVASLGIWAAAWGKVRKRGRESLARKVAPAQTAVIHQRLPTPSAPLALKLCWGLMIVGGLVALGIPTVLMFMIGPWLFPTIYFSLFVGLAAIARGASRDSVHLNRTASLQLANMIALDPANVVFAEMEFALLRSPSVKNYLSQAEQRSGGL